MGWRGWNRGDWVLCLAARPLIGLVETHLPGIPEKLFPLSVNTGRRIMRPVLGNREAGLLHIS